MFVPVLGLSVLRPHLIWLFLWRSFLDAQLSVHSALFGCLFQVVVSCYFFCRCNDLLS